MTEGAAQDCPCSVAETQGDVGPASPCPGTGPPELSASKDLNGQADWHTSDQPLASSLIPSVCVTYSTAHWSLKFHIRGMSPKLCALFLGHPCQLSSWSFIKSIMHQRPEANIHCKTGNTADSMNWNTSKTPSRTTGLEKGLESNFPPTVWTAD